MIDLTVEQVREIDRLATEKYGIPPVVLMENAGRLAAEETVRLARKTGVPSRLISILVICGSGNNAGDGFVCARHLQNTDYRVTTLCLSDPGKYRGNTLVNFNILKKMNLKIETFAGVDKLREEIVKYTLIIDAIFGTGLKGEVSGNQRDVINLVNSSVKPVVAVDIPSGLDGNTGLPLGTAVKAARTVTMGYSKKGFSHPAAKEFTGEVIVADIGYPKTIINDIS